MPAARVGATAVRVSWVSPAMQKYRASFILSLCFSLSILDTTYVKENCDQSVGDWTVVAELSERFSTLPGDAGCTSDTYRFLCVMQPFPQTVISAKFNLGYSDREQWPFSLLLFSFAQVYRLAHCSKAVRVGRIVASPRALVSSTA